VVKNVRNQVINGVDSVYEDQPYWDSNKQRGSRQIKLQ